MSHINLLLNTCLTDPSNCLSGSFAGLIHDIVKWGVGDALYTKKIFLDTGQKC